MSETSKSDPAAEDGRRVLTVRVAAAEDAFDELEDRFAALDVDEQPDPMFEVVLQTEADLNRLLRPTNVELLRTVSRKHPESIRETARLVDRDVRQVYDNLHELARLNLLHFEVHGPSKRPVVWYDDIDIELPIADEDPSAAAV